MPALIESIIILVDPEIKFNYFNVFDDPLSIVIYNFGLSVTGIVVAIKAIRNQDRAWFSNICLQAIIVFVQILAGLSLEEAGDGFTASYENTAGRLATVAISLTVLYLLSRKDARSYFVIKK